MTEPAKIDEDIIFILDDALKAQQENKEQHPDYYEAKVPATVQGDDMNQYQAARELRIIGRRLEQPSTFAIEKYLEQLHHVLTLPRGPKRTRLETFDSLQTVLENHLKLERATYERIAGLVQHLPTAQNLPADRDANVLRAMVAILKSNGVI